MSYYGSTAPTFIGSSIQGPSQIVSENEHHVPEYGPGEVSWDFVSFLALVSGLTSYTEWTAIGMSRVHITPSNIALSERKGQGSSFSISLIDRKEFSKVLPHDMVRLKHLPKLLAVKTPILDPELRTQRNRYIFDSMTREYRILNYKSLKNHENIVRLVGCCWRTVNTELDITVPNLVLEGSDLGDLEDFYQQHGNSITMRRRLGLCIDVVLGVDALHQAGILHGDIKPRNILVFKNEERGFIAKIADFGSSISLHHSTFPRKACPGTTLFYAPERLDGQQNYSRDGLLKAEIYTLGFLLAFLVRGPHILDRLSSASPDVVRNLKRQGEMANWLMQGEDLLTLDRMVRPTFGKDAAERGRQRGIWRWSQNQIINMIQAQRRKGNFSIFDNMMGDGDWITLANSQMKDEKAEILLIDIVNRVMLVEPTKRPADVQFVLLALRKILTLELYAVYDTNYQWLRLCEEQLASSRRRLNPEGLHEGLPAMLNSQEIDAAILNYALSPPNSYNSDIWRRPNVFRHIRFIWRFGYPAKFTKKHPRIYRLFTRTGRPEVKRKQERSMASQSLRVKEYMKLFSKSWSRHHQEPNEENWTDKDDVFQATLDERYTSLLPQSIRRELTKQLEFIADSPTEAGPRRLLASFEYALMILCYDDVSRSDVELISRALSYLYRAANLGHHRAQSMVGRLSALFDRVTTIGRDKEFEWLYQASLKGSLTAMERLRTLNFAAYEQAQHLLRFEYNGSYVKGELWKDTEYLLILISAGLKHVPPNFIHMLVAHGQLRSLKRISHLSIENFNTINGLGETPLVVACRCGHARVVELLLKLGADPSIGTFDSVHPLHFLSAFPEEDIPQMTDLLLQHGAQIEVHSQGGDVYRQGLDGRFGIEEGTPLLWSVWAGNITAIKELLRHGADAFSYRPLNEWDMRGDAVIYSSPLEAAINTYRYNIVDLLLSSCKDLKDLERGLNDLRLVGKSVSATPLLMALERKIFSRLRSTLFHGPFRHYAQLRTVETLLRYGSNPLRLSKESSGASVHAIELVCQDNNLSLLEFLWNYDEGKLRPSSEQYLECVFDAIRTSNRDIFDFLLSHQHEVPRTSETYKLLLNLLSKTCGLSSDIHYLSSVVASIIQGLPLAPSGATKRPDFTEQVFVSLVAGNIGAARLLCQYGNCSFTRPFDNFSVLARVIELDAVFPILQDRVGNLLHLVSSFLSVEEKSELFWKCAFHGDGGRRFPLTALQFAFIGQESTHGTTESLAAMNPRLLPNILRAFHEPEFLNAQINPRSLDFPGDTALHMAARKGCVKEIHALLNGQHGGSFDLNLRNVHNETPVDLFIAHHEKLVNELEERFEHLGSLSTEGTLLRKLADVEAAISSLLDKRECSISVFCLVAVKESQDTFLFMRRPNIKIRVPYVPGHTIGKYPLSANEHEDVDQLLNLEVSRLIPFVDSPSKYGKVLSKDLDSFIKKLA